jgi:hypothetical protein
VREFRISVEVLAPPDRVWRVMRDVERWPEWTPTVISIRLIGGAAIGVGSRVRIVQPKLPPAVWRTTEWDEGRGFTWVTGGLLVGVAARHEVEPAPSGTRVTLSVRFSGPLGGVAGRLTRDLNHRYLALEAKGLKEQSESRPASESPGA